MSHSIASVVDSLRGLKETRGGLEVVEEDQIVTWAERGRFPEKVKVISGGGAGHEPGHAGLVGRGFLTTAITGAIFTSPPVQSILRGILLTGDKDTPILLIVTNYSGDRLNFALAEKWATNRYGYTQIKTILVADDVALDDVPEQVGNRGLAGTILMHKIAGAMADIGKSLSDVYEFCGAANKQLKTIGFSYEVDWTELKIRNIELGKGVHGERGAYHIPDQDNFKGIAETVTEKFQKIIPNGRPVVLLLNNLGGPVYLFQLICNDMIGELSKFLTIVKVISGPLFTSLKILGASVTLLELDDANKDETLRYLEYKTDVHYDYFKPAGSSSFSNEFNLDTNTQKPVNYKGTTVDGRLFQHILRKICEAILLNVTSLNEMDSEFGDGDTGSTLSRGAQAITGYLNDPNNEHSLNYPFVVYKTISYLLSCKMGGTSGALLGMFFESASEAFRTTDFQSPLWLQFGNQALAEAGRSARGHRTMLDVLLVAEDVLQNPLDLELLQKKCRSTVLATKQMIPRSGRAVYTQSTTTMSKYPDPGAALIGIIVDTVVEAISN